MKLKNSVNSTIVLVVMAMSIHSTSGPDPEASKRMAVGRMEPKSPGAGMQRKN